MDRSVSPVPGVGREQPAERKATDSKASERKAAVGRTQDGRRVRVLDRADLPSLLDGTKPGMVLLRPSPERQAAAQDMVKHLQLYRACIARPSEPAHPSDEVQARADIAVALSQWPIVHLGNLSEALGRFFHGGSFYDSRVAVLRELQREVDEEMSRLDGPGSAQWPEISFSPVSKEDSCEGHALPGAVPPAETKARPLAGGLVRSSPFYHPSPQAAASTSPPPVAWSQPVPPVDRLQVQGLAFAAVGRKPLPGDGPHQVLGLTVIVDDRPLAGVFKCFAEEPRDAGFHARTGIDPEAPAWLQRALAVDSVERLIRTGLVPPCRIAILEMDGVPRTGLLMDRAIAGAGPMDTGDGRLRMLTTRLRWMDLLNGEAARGPDDWMAGRDRAGRWQVAALAKGSGFGCKLTVEEGATPVPSYIDKGLCARLLQLEQGALHSALSPLLDGLEVLGQCSRLEDIRQLLQTPGRVIVLEEDEQAWAELPGPRAASSTTTSSSSSSSPAKPLS